MIFKMRQLVYGWIAILLSMMGVAATQLTGNPSDDPFSPYISANKASFMLGGEVNGERGREVKIISRKLSLPVDFFIHHSRTKRDLTLMPHTSPRDKVFELTDIFPNCKDRPSLWVVYNETSGYVIAYADILLRSSVNDYVYRYVENQINEKRRQRLRNSGDRVRFSITYIEVDREVPLTIERLNQASHRLLWKRAGEVRMSERCEFSSGEGALTVEHAIMDNHQAVSVLYTVTGSNEIKSSAKFKLNELGICLVGMVEGNKKRVMLVKYELTGLEGKVDETQEKKAVSESLKVPQGAVDVTSKFEGVFNSMVILGDITTDLVVPPAWMDAGEDEVVHNWKKMFELTGVKFAEDEWILNNRTTGKLYFNLSAIAYEQIEDLCSDLGTRNSIRMMTSSIAIYEVDNRRLKTKKWDLQAVMSAKPELLGMVSSYSRSGEKNSYFNELGEVEVSMFIDQNSVDIGCDLRLDLILKGREVKLNIEDKMIKNNGVDFIELGMEGSSSRVILLIIDTKYEISDLNS